MESVKTLTIVVNLVNTLHLIYTHYIRVYYLLLFKQTKWYFIFLYVLCNKY